MKRLIGKVLLVLLWLPGLATAAQAASWEVGLRGGQDAKDVVEHYTVGELYLLHDLPWVADSGVGRVQTRIDLGVGALEADHDRGVWLAAGADLVWLPGNGLFTIEAGFRPAWLTDHSYGEDDFGGDLQFASHVGFAVNVSQFVVSYRYQHLSNAGIYDPNGGLDLHLFGLGGRF